MVYWREVTSNKCGELLNFSSYSHLSSKVKSIDCPYRLWSAINNSISGGASVITHLKECNKKSRQPIVKYAYYRAIR